MLPLMLSGVFYSTMFSCPQYVNLKPCLRKLYEVYEVFFYFVSTYVFIVILKWNVVGCISV